MYYNTFPSRIEECKRLTLHTKFHDKYLALIVSQSASSNYFVANEGHVKFRTISYRCLVSPVDSASVIAGVEHGTVSTRNLWRKLHDIS